ALADPGVPGQLQGGPHRYLVRGEYRLAECSLQAGDHVVRGQVGAADEDRLGGVVVDAADELDGRLVGDCPDLGDQPEAGGRHHFDPGLGEERGQSRGQVVRVWRDGRDLV